MKKRTFLGIILSIIGIFLLLGLGIFVTIVSRNTFTETEALLFSELHSEQPVSSSETEQTESITGSETEFLTGITEPFEIPKLSEETTELSETTELLETAEHPSDNNRISDQQTADALAAAKAETAPLPEHHIIFVGDSRTVGMYEAEMKVNDTCLYIGEVGEGYHWFEKSGRSQMEEAMEQYPDSPVIINLGVNDPDALPQYLALYQTFEETYPGHSFYFMSVNPVTEKCKNRTNEEIAEFNRQLREAFPRQYVDTNTYLQIREFESADGIHYSKDTYRMIHDYMVKQLF